MSLLDFAIGAVGGAAAGAAQGLQAQHKSRLEEQRQANLMRLKAQHKQEEVDSTVELLQAAQGGDPDAGLRLTAMGVNVRGSQGESPIAKLWNDYSAAVQSGDERRAESIMARISREETGSGRLTGGLMEIIGPHGESIIRQADHPDVAEALNNRLVVRPVEFHRWRDPDTDLLYESFGETVWRIDPSGRVQVSGPPTSAQEAEPTATEESMPPPSAERTEPLSATDFMSSVAALNPLTGEIIPPGDYIGMATGLGQASQRFLLATPLIGDILSEVSDMGRGQTRATQAYRFLRRDIVTLYRYNPTRTTNMDVKDAEKLAAPFGAFTTSAASLESMLEARRQIGIDINREKQIMNPDSGLPATGDARRAAREFVIRAEGALQKIDGVIAAHMIHNTRINNKPVHQMSQQDIQSLGVERIQNLNDNDRLALQLWIQHKGW